MTALSRNGLGLDELNSVRVDLGLAPKGGMDTDIGHRSVVPLSRQQIRAILDRHADTINNYNAQQNNGAEHIRKSAEIYRGGRMSDDNIAKRDEVNETLLAGTRIVNENRAIARFQAIVADNADFCGSDERAVRLDIARGLLDALLTKCRGVPGDAEPYVARLKLEGGQVLMMPTGLSERDFLARLENIIVRLAKLPSPREDELSTRLEYKRLKTFARLLKNDIMSGVKAFDSKEQCEAAFRKIVDDFVKERFDVMDEIDRQDPIDRSGSVAVRREPQQACAGRVQMKERRPAETAGLLCADERPVTSRRLLVRRRVRLSRSRPARTSRRRYGRNACRNDGRGA